MTAFIVLMAVCIAITAAVVWVDHRGLDPWPWLYGTTDPRELVDRARDRGESDV